MKERKKYEVIRQISEILNSLLPKKNIIVTIVDLILPQRGGKLKVYLSIFPEKERKELISYFNENSFKIKNLLKDRLFLRHLPSKIVFYSSDEISKAQKVLKLINEISQKEKKGAED